MYVVYWSGTGNTEAMANAGRQGDGSFVLAKTKEPSPCLFPCPTPV